VYEDEDEESSSSNQSSKDNKPVYYFIGPHSGVDFSYIYSQFNSFNISSKSGICLSVLQDPFFIQTGINYSFQERAKLNLLKHFESPYTFTDSTMIIISEFSQIIGNDTVVTQVYEPEYFENYDTIYSDTIYSHKNYYTNITIPISIGYSKTKRTYMFGVDIGVQCKFLVGNNSNKFPIENKEFANENAYLKPIIFEGIINAVARQKITRKIWLKETCSISIPLMNNYNTSNCKIYRSNFFASIGLEYRIYYHDQKYILY